MNQFVQVAVTAGHFIEASGQADGPLFQATGQDGFGPAPVLAFQLVGGHADHVRPQGGMPSERGDVGVLLGSFSTSSK